MMLIEDVHLTRTVKFAEIDGLDGQLVREIVRVTV